MKCKKKLMNLKMNSNKWRLLKKNFLTTLNACKVFLLDKFCVGDSFYHYLSVINNDLNKSYFIKQRRAQLNDMCHISSTPRKPEGAEASFPQLL